jgi:hypothetical protein
MNGRAGVPSNSGAAMPPSRLSKFLLAAALSATLPWHSAAACNPNPPRPAALEHYAYDATAAGYLQRDAGSIVAARLALRVDLEIGDSSVTPAQADYIFEVLEGWKAVVPHRLTLGGYWLSCALDWQAGRVFLLYLEGDRLLHAVPVEQLDFELTLLAEPDWFYDARGRLVEQPEAALP